MVLLVLYSGGGIDGDEQDTYMYACANKVVSAVNSKRRGAADIASWCRKSRDRRCRVCMLGLRVMISNE